MKIELLEETSSTNEYIACYLGARENVIVCARRQTGGKGTKGRSFLSNEGGVYLSALFFYRDLPASRAFEVMAHAAVAVCRTAEAFGAQPEIKWANDVLIGRKKLCGILIENGVRGDLLDHSVIGVGLNVENDVSALGDIAVNLSEAAGRRVTAEAAREKLIAELLRPTKFAEYLSRVKFLGREVTVEENGRAYRAIAEEILPDGRLVVKGAEGARPLSSAEITLKL